MDAMPCPAVYPFRSNAAMLRWLSDRAGGSPARWIAPTFPAVSKFCCSCSCRFAFQTCDFGESPPVTFGATESGLEKRADQLPGERTSDYAATQADHVHVVVLDSLMR